jgi:hypothetical protein
MSSFDSIPPQNSGLPKIFLANLLALLLLGVSACLWVLHFTNWFPAIGGFLALGGAFSWLAFVFNILKKDRLEELQDWADRVVFGSGGTLSVVLILFAALLVVWMGTTTVQVESLQTESTRGLWVLQEGSTKGDPEQLPAGQEVRYVAWHLPWSSHTYRVKVSGYPELKVAMRAPRRANLVVPDHFLQPVLVFRPTVDLLNSLRGDPMKLVVNVREVAGSERVLAPYAGQAVWIGCDADVDVPPARLDAWRAELGARVMSHLLYFWAHPTALPAPSLQLQAGQTVKIAVETHDGSEYAKGSFVVVRIQQRYEFPQEVTLDAPH